MYNFKAIQYHVRMVVLAGGLDSVHHLRLQYEHQYADSEKNIA